MEFRLNEEQSLLRDSVRRWTEKNYDFESRKRLARSKAGFSSDAWSEMASLGWLAILAPEECGGLGWSMIEASIVTEELGRLLALEPYTAVAVTAATVLGECPGAISATLLTALVDGRAMPVLAHGESGAGGETAWVETRATTTDSAGWSLTGAKSLVIGGPAADHLIVSARTSGAVGDQAGISLFLVRPDAPGISRTDYRNVDGSRASDFIFDRVAVEEGALLGDVGAAFPTIDLAMQRTLIALCAEAVGLMDNALWITRDYLRTRQQFGTPIASFQALQHRAADMCVEIEQSRSMVWRALDFSSDPNPRSRSLAASAAKAQIGKSGKFVTGQAIQLHGGVGVTEEYVIGHYFKRMTVIELLFGNTQDHLGRLAAQIRDEA